MGSAKMAVAIFVAGLAIIACCAAYGEYIQYREEQSFKPFEQVKVWKADLPKSLGLKFSARTKIRNRVMFVDLSAEGFPPYLSDPVMWKKNSLAKFTVTFVDADDFKLAEKEIQVGEFLRTVGKDGKLDGLNIQYDDGIDLERYKNIKGMNISWTVETDMPNQSSRIVSEGNPLDHCAPGLSKAERLKRLSTHGLVREAGAGTYRSGGHQVTYIAGELFNCD